MRGKPTAALTAVLMIVMLVITVLPIPAMAGTVSSNAPNPGTGQDFKTTSPESVGLDGQALAEAVNFASSRGGISVRILRHGYLVDTSWLDPITGAVPNNIWSSTKGVVSLLTGRALTLGKLSLDDPIGKYVPEADAAHGKITIRQLLTQSSGLEFSWVADLDLLMPDSVKQVLALPFAHDPGTYFEYAQTTVTLLAYTVEKAVGEDLQVFAQEQLFGPLGIPRTDWFWLRDRAGHTQGFAYLFMPPKDLTRLGQLTLQGGVWNGKVLLSADYVKQAQTPSASNPVYGYLLWTNEGDYGFTPTIPNRRRVEGALVPSAPRDMYAFVGFLDQMIFIIPSWDMVVVRTGVPGNLDLTDLQAMLTAYTGDWMYDFFQLLGKAVKDVQVPDTGPYQSRNEGEGLDLGALVNVPQIVGGLGLGGSYSPPGVNLLGSGDQIAYIGLVQSVLDIGQAVVPLARNVLANLLEETGSTGASHLARSPLGGILQLALPRRLLALENTWLGSR